MDKKENYSYEELNELRYKIFNLIIEGRKTGDMSALFPYIGDECKWNGKTGRDNVIEDLKHINVNYKHDSVIVQLGPKDTPTWGMDENGKRVGFIIYYNAGEICMLDRTVHQTYLFRLDMTQDGKVNSFYATCPAFYEFEAI